MALTVTLGVPVEADGREYLEARRKLLEEAAGLVSEELSQIERATKKPMQQLIERWEMRVREHQAAAETLSVAAHRADDESEMLSLEIKRDRQDLQFRFWRETARKARSTPWRMRESAMREVVQHAMLRDLWQTVLDELDQLPREGLLGNQQEGETHDEGSDR